MSQSLLYACNILTGDKRKQLQRDEHGYFDHALGAFNIYNRSKVYYPLMDKVKEQFKPGSILMRRIGDGQLRGELEHPAPTQGQTLMEFIQRVCTIKSDRVSHHIASVRLEPSKDAKGNPIVLVVGRVKPAGPYKDTLEASLLNPEENVAFSIRSLADEKINAGRREKHVTTIVTWDYVNEPGIEIATKYHTPTLEAVNDEIVLPKEAFMGARDAMRDNQMAVGFEGADDYITHVLTNMGWETVRVTDPAKLWYKW